MFLHNFKYTLKTLFRNKTLIFWTFAFPVILGTFFYLAFSNIENSEKLDIIPIAIVDSKENDLWRQTLEEFNKKENLFEIYFETEEISKKLLEEEKIIGYMKIENEKPKLVFSTNGIDETIFKYVIEEIVETSTMIYTISEEEIKKDLLLGKQIDSIKVMEQVLKLIEENTVNIKNISRSNLSYTMIEFYTLIAMTCLYGGILGMITMNQNLANMTNQGKRVSVSPISKRKIIISSVSASYLVQVIGFILLFLYTIFVLKVDYGSHLNFVILISLIGCLAGLSLGIFIATIIKTNENTKTGIMIAITMIGCFLSGMMGITMKYVIDKNIPIINLLNPASMITDGLYSLYYYDTWNRYIWNISSLLVFSILLISISFISLRRQKYDRI